jgi:site-specific DNA-methyltransferase (adenine-specific)
MRFELHHGDSREVLKGMAEASVDSIVCDPPYHLTNKGGGPHNKTTNAYSRAQAGAGSTGFMGMTWDGGDVAMRPEVWAECLRVLKPGGYLLAFSGTRTYHRMACAIEDVGFEVRDQIGWLYGSGFPKSHNGEWGGTALKPAWEPIVMARKPLVGTVEANWLAYGTGALNIDACRIEAEPVPTFADKGERAQHVFAGGTLHGSNRTGEFSTEGRWPANVIHDGSDEVLAAFPETASGTGAVKRASSADEQGNTGAAFGAESRPAGTPMVCHGDAGSAARFFYCAKADQVDRNEGCGTLPKKAGGMVSNTSGQHITRRDGGAPGPRANHHPTVKPTDLMRYLCRLVTPAGGVVLDPFMGSGSTGKAAMLEGLRFIGIDLTAEYVEIARARIDFAARQGWQPNLLEEA